MPTETGSLLFGPSTPLPSQSLDMWDVSSPIPMRLDITSLPCSPEDNPDFFAKERARIYQSLMETSTSTFSSNSTGNINETWSYNQITPSVNWGYTAPASCIPWMEGCHINPHFHPLQEPSLNSDALVEGTQQKSFSPSLINLASLWITSADDFQTNSGSLKS
ncbi:hypothetical protein HMI55_003497, partial [Coelomomyces lativittatus]